MSTYARVVYDEEKPGVGDVVEVIDLPDGQTPQTNYTPEVAAMFIACPADVTEFWTYENGQWLPPPAPGG